MLSTDPLEVAIRVGAICALRRRAVRQAAAGAAGTVSAGDHLPVLIQTGEAVIAFRLAQAFTELANEFEAERGQ